MESGIDSMREHGGDRRETAGQTSGHRETTGRTSGRRETTSQTGGRREMQGGRTGTSTGQRHQTGEWVSRAEQGSSGSDSYPEYGEPRPDLQQGERDRHRRGESEEYSGREQKRTRPQSRSPSGSAGTSGRIETPRAEHRTGDESETESRPDEETESESTSDESETETRPDEETESETRSSKKE